MISNVLSWHPATPKEGENGWWDYCSPIQAGGGGGGETGHPCCLTHPGIRRGSWVQGNGQGEKLLWRDEVLPPQCSNEFILMNLLLQYGTTHYIVMCTYITLFSFNNCTAIKQKYFPLQVLPTNSDKKS
jgi:hypothetical protein